MLKVYTGRIEPWDPARVEKLAADVDAVIIDVTRKSGDAGIIFAPSWELLTPALEAREAAKKLRKADAAAAERLWAEAWAVYVRGYLAEMRESYRLHRDGWEELLSFERVALLCYCGDPLHCHRALLRQHILPRLGACNAGELGVDYPAYRVAVSGTRPPRLDQDRRIYEKLAADCRATILGLDPGATVVHGNADGIDSVARDAARERGLLDEPHLPDPGAHGGDYRAALLARNVYVTTVGETGWVVAWPSPWGTGTQHAISLAKTAGIKVIVRGGDGQLMLP